MGESKNVVVLGDFNQGAKADGSPADNFADLFDSNGPLVDCYIMQGFDLGPKPGTYDSCSTSNRLDYILISQSLVPAFTGGGIFRMGLWGDRVSRPTAWQTYPEIADSNQPASDHAAVYIDLNV